MSRPSGATSFLPLIILVASLVFVSLLLCGLSRRIDTNSELQQKWGLRLKLLISTYQIIGTFTWTLGTAFPSILGGLLAILSSISLEFSVLFPTLACLDGYDYLADLLVVTCVPLLLFIVPILIYWLFMSVVARDAGGTTRSLKSLLIVSFILYAPVSSKIFRALRPCDEFVDVGVAYMPEDYSGVCGSDTHGTVLGVAYTMLFLYCLGIPLFYFTLLWPRRQDIQEQCRISTLKNPSKEEVKRKDLNQKLEEVSFLFQSYWHWWWELVEIIRKIFLAGLITLVAPGTAEQSIVLMLLALLSTVLYHHFLPFRDENLLGLVASYSVFFAAFASFLVKLNRDYLSSDIMDVLLVVVVLLPLGFALILTEGVIRTCEKSCFARPADAAVKTDV